MRRVAVVNGAAVASWQTMSSEPPSHLASA